MSGMKSLMVFVLLMGFDCIATAQDDFATASQDGLLGYIDRSGNWVIEPMFVEASDWEDGAARVRLPNGDLAFIDGKGKYLMQPRRFQRLGDLHEGLAVFEPVINPHAYDTDEYVKNVGFIDVTGRVVISPHLVAADDFSEGVAAASVDFGKCGYIDKQGNFAIEPKFESLNYEDCGLFSEGVAHAKRGEKFGYIDHTGSFLLLPIYDYAYDFSDGYAVVEIGSRYRFIDKHGAALGTLSYSFARAFTEGLAAVAPNDKWGFIDKSGSMVISPKYEEVGDFSEGLAWVQIDGKRGYIDMRGDLIVPPKYDRVSDFWNGMAEVVQNRTRDGSRPEVHTIINAAGTPIRLQRK